MTPLLATTRYGSPDGHPPLVLVHGLSGEQSAWRRVVPDLVAFGREVITVDLPGFGRSPEAEDPWTMDGAAQALLDTLTELGFDEVVLVGHSMGGGVVMRAAARAPERVVGLVPIAPAGWLGTGDGDVSEAEVSRNAALRLALRLGIGQLVRVPRLREIVFQNLVSEPRELSARAAVDMTRGFRRSRQSPQARAAIYLIRLQDDLPKLTMPVHAVWGTADRVVGPQFARNFRQVPTAEVTMLPGVGHIPMEESPEAVVRAVRDVVERSRTKETAR